MPTKTYQVRFTEKGGKKVENQTKKVTGSLKGLAIQAAKAGGAFFAAQGLLRGISSSIELFGIQEQAEKRLEVALGRTSQALLDQAKALQVATKFGDEAVISVQASIAAFIDNEDQIKAATAATLDFAEATGMDLKGAGDLIAKTLGSSTNAMSRYGLEVTGTVGSTERLLSLTNAVASKFGGQAAAAAGTAAGKIEQMKNAVGDAAEAFGGLLVPIVVPLASGLKFLAEGAQAVINAFNFSNTIVPELVGLQTPLDKFKESISGLTTKELLELNNTLGGALPENIGVLGTSLDEIQKNTLLQKGFILPDNSEDIALLIEKLVEVQTAIQATDEFTKGLILTNELLFSEENREAIENESLALQGIVAVEQKVLDLKQIRADFEKKSSKERKKQVLEDLKNASLSGARASDVAKAIIAAESREAVAGLISSIFKSLPFPANVIAAAGAGRLATGYIDDAVNAIPKFATGADFVADSPQLGIFGEAGPERVQITPLAGPNINGPQDGSGINITIQGDVLDGADFRDKVGEAINMINQGIA